MLAVVASWSLTQEMAGSSHFTIMTKIFVTKFSEFSETFRENSNVFFNTVQVFAFITWPRHFDKR